MLSLTAYARSICPACRRQLLRPTRFYSWPQASLPRILYSTDSADTINAETPPHQHTRSSSEPVDKPAEQRQHGRSRLGPGSVADATNVEVSVLGRPAQPTITRTSPSGSISATALEEQVLGDTVGSGDALSEPLQGGERPATVEEARRNIDELWPRDSTVLPEKNFRSLAEILVEGFTSTQLQYYMDVFPKDRLDSYGGTKVGRYPWALKISPWVPLGGNEGEISKPKEKIVLGLMRNCWGLRIRELMDGRGTLKVKARHMNLTLLLLDANKHFLQELTRTYLDEGDRIEVVRLSRSLRIISQKAKAETVLDRLNGTFSRVKTDTFFFPSIGKLRLSMPQLEELGRVTSTVVTYDASSSKVRVSWLQLDEPREHLEQPIDTVRRLMLSALGIGVYKKTEMTCFPGRGHGHFVSDSLASSRPLSSWIDRLFSWSRWVTGRGKTKGSRMTQSIPPLMKPLLTLPITAVKATPGPEDVWTKTRVSATATFGHILHLTPRTERQKLLANGRRILSPILPPPESYDLTSMASSFSSPEWTVAIKFVADPRHRLPNRTYPNLELHVRPKADGSLDWETCSKQCVAALATFESDILLPEDPVDLRVTRQVLSEMSTVALQSSAPLRNFFELSQLELQAGKLTTPAHMVLPLPQSLLHGATSNLANQGSATDVRFVFTGIELRHSMHVTFPSHRLQHSSVEAGLHGGRRSELSLVASADVGQVPGDEGVERSDRFETLVDSAIEIARSKFFPRRLPRA